jgi:acyl-CoA synthetase (AMP-forming)/AMP-acid ligase II
LTCHHLTAKPTYLFCGCGEKRQPWTAEEVEAHCHERLTDYKVLRRIEFVEVLRKPSTRKIDKVSLREEF